VSKRYVVEQRTQARFMGEGSTTIDPTRVFIVEASSPRAAIRQATRRVSVLDLRRGVEFVAYRLRRPRHFYRAQYRNPDTADGGVEVTRV